MLSVGCAPSPVDVLIQVEVGLSLHHIQACAVQSSQRRVHVGFITSPRQQNSAMMDQPHLSPPPLSFFYLSFPCPFFRTWAASAKHLEKPRLEPIIYTIAGVILPVHLPNLLRPYCGVIVTQTHGLPEPTRGQSWRGWTRLNIVIRIYSNVPSHEYSTML